MEGRETLLITGGGSGIGMGFAREYHSRNYQVIIAGRTRAKLDAVVAQCPGMLIEEVDISDAKSVANLAARVSAAHPNLSTLFNNAGIQTLLDFRSAPLPADSITREVDTNLKGLMLVSNAFLPLLRRQKTSRLIHVGSGLGYVPLASAPVYSATKAAVHSFTISLRKQLAGGTVRVIEIVPPVVETELHRGQPKKPPGAMSLDSFISEAMRDLDRGVDEVVVGRARILRLGARLAPQFFMKIVNKPRN